jgi:DNA-binding winged helix-turn-helix (wHTH) protein
LPIKVPRLFFLGDWQVNPRTNTLRRGDIVKTLEPKAMDVLRLLCAQQGQVLSVDDIADKCWGDVDIGDNPVHKVINQLRKALEDKASTPTYIATIRKRGYHIIAELDFPLDDALKAVNNNCYGASPFPGLMAFAPNDASLFFGRNEQIATLLVGLSKQVSTGHAFCLILGPSGTGKSSLVNAGLLPVLTRKNGYDDIGVESFTCIDFADISHQRLFVDLASAMLDWDVNEQPVFTGMSAEKLAIQLQNDYKASIEQCVNALKKTQQGYSNPRFLLFIDRLEVLLSSVVFSDDERSAFLGLIDKLATSDAIIVVSACRNDFYPLVVNYPSLMVNKGNGGHFDLLAPTRAELLQMIRLPAVAANLTWSVDEDSATPLDQILCAEAANNPDALPMLQYTLQELYLQRSEADKLQVPVYKALGGIAGAIGKKAEQVYQQLPGEQQSQLAAVLSRLVTVSPDRENITSRAARWSELSQVSETSFVRAMVNSRLFVSHLQNDEACFSLAHEALLRRWPRASEWITAHKGSLVIKSRLQQLTQRWLKEDKSSAYLLPQGKPLEEALSLQNMPVFTLNSNELALLHASQQKVNTKRWLTRSTFALLCVLTFTAILMSVKSQQAEGLALQKRLEAESLLGFMVGEFADKLRSVKRMDLLDGISNKAFEYFSQQEHDYDDSGLFSLSDSSLNFKARFQHAQTLGAMGEVAYSRAKTDEAEQAFVAAKVILDKLYVEQADNLELLKTLGGNAFWLGQLAYDQNDFETAQPLFELYRNYSEEMKQLEPESIVGWIELSYAQNTLGSLYLELQEYKLAKLAFKTSLFLKQRALSQSLENGDLQIDIAGTFSWLGKIELHFGELTDSVQYMQQGQKILEQLLKSSPDNARIMELLILSNIAQAKIFNIKGKYKQAVDKLTVAENLLHKTLKQDKNNQYWQNDLLRVHIFKAGLNAKLDNRSEMLISHSSELIDTIFSYQQKSLAISVMAIDYFQIKELWQESKQYIRQASRELLPDKKKITTSSNEILILANFEVLEAKQLLKQNQKTKAHQVCKKTIQRLRPLIIKSQSPYFLVPYVQAYDCIEQLSLVSNELQLLSKMGINVNQFTTQNKKN